MWALTRHKVKDYAAWRLHFDGSDALPHRSGATRGQVFRSAADPDELWILLEWESAERAREFMQSHELREAMERAGIADEADITFLDELAPPSL